MWLVVILAIVLGGFLFWVAIPWLWAHVSLGGGLLLSGSLLVGTPVAPDGKAIQKQMPPTTATVVAVAPTPQIIAPYPQVALRAAVANEVRQLREQRTAKCDCAEFNPPVIVSPDNDESEFNPPVIVRPQRHR